MLGYILLLSGLEIIHEGQIQYIRLALYVVITLLIGTGLWLAGFDLLESDRKAYRIGGVFVLFLAAGFSIGLVGLCYWQYTYLMDYLQ